MHKKFTSLPYGNKTPTPIDGNKSRSSYQYCLMGCNMYSHNLENKAHNYFGDFYKFFFSGVKATKNS